jgi:hypothetical protein
MGKACLTPPFIHRHDTIMAAPLVMFPLSMSTVFNRSPSGSCSSDTPLMSPDNYAGGDESINIEKVLLAASERRGAAGNSLT